MGRYRSQLGVRYWAGPERFEPGADRELLFADARQNVRNAGRRLSTKARPAAAGFW